MEITGTSTTEDKYRLVGLHLGVLDKCVGDNWINYDLGTVALCALEALQSAILAMEQVVTGERLVKSLDVGDFYNHLSEALAVENGQGVLSEPGSMSSLDDEIQGLIDLINNARRVARCPKGA